MSGIKPKIKVASVGTYTQDCCDFMELQGLFCNFDLGAYMQY